jgi:Ser/Thr protein kinase RdoA (MazF antagonist)
VHRLRTGAVSVDDFASLSRRRQLSRLRRLGRTALMSYGLENVRLALQRFEHNTTFRVDAPSRRFLLRINRPEVHTAGTIASEMAWLTALRRDTDLPVPDPVAALDGSMVVLADDPGVTEAHACILLRWLDGRFIHHRLTPAHVRGVGTLAGRLQEHSATWRPPRGFVRPRIDTLTNEAKRNSITGSAALALSGDHPSQRDAERAVGLVGNLVSAQDAAVVERALDVVWATTRKLATSEGFGLVHGDLHHENVLYWRDDVGAIDFDDCGWGFHLYDLAVTLSELDDRPRYTEMRAGLLEGYADVGHLPDDHLLHLSALVILRRMQILLWILESRGHASFRDEWRKWARHDMDAIAVDLASHR